MKPFVLITLTIVALLLGACGGATAPAAPMAAPIASSNEATPTPLSATYLKIDYADATSVRNQLALGTLKLEGTQKQTTIIAAPNREVSITQEEKTTVRQGKSPEPKAADDEKDDEKK